MKFAKLALLATAMAVTPFAANAQDVGATVYGNDGEAIGTVESNDGTNVVLAVGEYTATLPVRIFGTSEAGPTINTTRAAVEGQLAAAAEQRAAASAEAQAAAAAEAEAKLAEALVVGAPVVTADNMALGTVSEFSDENVVIENADAGLITLGRNFMAVDADGNIVARANFDAIMAAVQGG